MPKTMKHWNGNLLCAVDTETSGLDPFYNELLQICILPLDANIDPLEGVLPFYINLIPECPYNVDEKALEKNGLNMADLTLRGFDRYKAIDLLEEWIKNLKLPTTSYGTPKQLMPLGHNYSFDKPFIIKWLGNDIYNQIFNYHHHDTMIAAHYLNDRAAFHNEKVPFNKTNLQWLASTYKIKTERAHDALSDCVTTAKIYKQMIASGLIF